MTQKINAAGLAIVKEFEGLRLDAYPDPGTGGDPWTVGYGHTGPEVRRGLKITKAQADEYLKKDLEKFERHVAQMVQVEITDNMFSALVSLCYNIGPGNLGKSTLIRSLNVEDFNRAQAEFSKWNRAAGRVMPGLTRRREAEAKLFGTP
uniref:lysozyme n=1 Tax=Methylobacterium sp. B34 TaxID=95563 RepID=UPI00034CDB03|nr:lysozyme [Methylobacterium sp. B34]